MSDTPDLPKLPVHKSAIVLISKPSHHLSVLEQLSSFLVTVHPQVASDEDTAQKNGSRVFMG